MKRRTFVQLSAGAAPFIASACALPVRRASVSGTATGGTPQTTASTANVYPTYIPVQNGPKPDYPSSGPDYEDGFDRYPTNPVKALPDEPPGAGSTVTVMTVQLTPPPTPLDQNVAWQAVNRALNANVQFQLVSQADYQAKLATVMASTELPDVVFLIPRSGSPSALAAAPGLPQFLQSQAADLSPYLAGDAAREYPYLAATPTIIWKNVGCAYQGHLYLTPVPRTQLGQLWMKNAGVYDRDIGQDYVPKNADDFKRVLQVLTRPQEQFYGIASAQGTTMLVPLFSQMFGAPNAWRLESDGKLTRAWETPEYKAATGYVRDLWTAGVFHPDTANYASAVVGRNNFSAGKFAIYPGDTPLAWRDAWRDDIAAGQPFDIHFLGLFPAYDGGKPQTFLVGGNLYGSFLKKAPPERIKELLRILNWLAAPFGSAEDQLLTYGIKDVDYTLDQQGQPTLTRQGMSDVNYAPWSRVAQHPFVWFAPDLPNWAKQMTDVQKTVMPYAVKDPTFGLISDTASSKGIVADQTVSDAITDMVIGRRPLSDYDQVVKDWQNAAGEQVRQEYMQALQAAS